MKPKQVYQERKCEMEETKLKPCPFCGADADADANHVTEFRLASDGVIWAEIYCKGCAARIVECADENEAFKGGGDWIFNEYMLDRARQAAVKAWNMRPTKGGAK